MARKTKTPSSLAQKDTSWYCAVRRLRTWVEDEKQSEEYFRPYLLWIVEQEAGAVLNVEILKTSPEVEEIQQKLHQTMLKPAKGSLTPHRPLEIHFEDKALSTALQPLLQGLGIVTRYQPQRKRMDGLIDMLQSEVFGEEDELPGLLKQKGVKPEQIGRLYQAAASFYQAQPWLHLIDADLLAVRVGDQRDPYYVSMMGNAGQEFGLSVFLNWQEVESFFTAVDPVEELPEEGRQVFFFDSPPMVSFDDLDAIEKYAWPLPEPNVYPTPLIFTPDDVLRPSADMLRWYEAVLLALPEFFEKQWRTDPDGSHPPVAADQEVPTSAGKTRVHVEFPGGDLDQVRTWIANRDFSDLSMAELDELDVLDEIPYLDQRGMEGSMAQLTRSMGGLDVYSDPSLYKAQDIMYEAWDETDPARREKLAKKALKTSPDCADAYVLLAEQARSDEQSLELYQKGVEAGRRALGEDFFADPDTLGNFWGILETRPYMRAMQGVANTLWELGRLEEALALLRELLRLNPGDNQGNRYTLLDLLLELGRTVEATALLKDYSDEWSADWAYTEALLSFQKSGDSPQSRQALKHGLEVNRHVVDYLSGKKRIPANDFSLITMGGEDEAIDFASRHLNHWRKTPGAVAWLKTAAVKRTN